MAGKKRGVRARRGAGKPAGRKNFHHGSLPDALLGAVGSIIQERGLSEVSLREAARRANVSHGAPAHHFRNKQGLLTAFAAQGHERLREEVGREFERSRPRNGKERLAAMGRGYVAFAVKHPEQFELMFRMGLINPRDPAYKTAADSTWNLLLDAVQACAREGRLGDRDPLVVATAAWSLTHGLAVLWNNGRLEHRLPPGHNVTALADAVTHLYTTSVLGP